MFVSGCRETLKAVEQDAEVAAFVRQLRVIGTFWYLAFPLVVFGAGVFPRHHRHDLVTSGCLALQSAALMYLSHLLLRSERYERISNWAKAADEEVRPLQEAPKTTTLGELAGKKVKVALE